MTIKDIMGVSINPTALMNDYIDGFLAGLETKFREQVKADKSIALVLVKDEDVTKEYNDRRFIKTTATSAKKLNDQQAKIDGFKQGKSFSGAPKGHITEGAKRIKR